MTHVRKDTWTDRREGGNSGLDYEDSLTEKSPGNEVVCSQNLDHYTFFLLIRNTSIRND